MALAALDDGRRNGIGTPLPALVVHVHGRRDKDKENKQGEAKRETVPVAAVGRRDPAGPRVGRLPTGMFVCVCSGSRTAARYDIVKGVPWLVAQKNSITGGSLCER